MRLSMNSIVSLVSFSAGCTVLFIPVPSLLGEPFRSLFYDSWLLLASMYAAEVLGFLYMYFVYKPQGDAFKIAWRAALLGSGFCMGILANFLAPPSWIVFGWYTSILCFFHFSEYFTTAIINPKSPCLDSFLLNHSVEYGLAVIMSWAEFLVERYFFPEWKQLWTVSRVGLILCISGELVRKIAMFTAGTNFSHIIQDIKEEGHILVTHGIYSWCRHPSYVGWFWWTVGTQLVLCNPFCLIVYVVASWKFLRHRVREEEIRLFVFFGKAYVKYQKNVGTGLPFIRGFRAEL